jgi:polypeptide N-acetylgalactosaminyltransferase
MRTVHSVFNTSPPELIAEVIMVDDFSNKEFLKDNLDRYVKRFNGKVKVVRTEKRVGLVRARVIGAEHATGQVIVVLDAHCECVTNWLPPLLTRIAVNRLVLIY